MSLNECQEKIQFVNELLNDSSGVIEQVEKDLDFSLILASISQNHRENPSGMSLPDIITFLANKFCDSRHENLVTLSSTIKQVIGELEHVKSEIENLQKAPVKNTP